MKNLLYACCAMALILASCDDGSKAAADLENKNKEKITRFYDEVFNKKDVTVLDSFVAENFVDHTMSPGYEPNKAGTAKSFTEMFAAYPDLNAKVNFVLADGDKVISHFTMSGTNSGPMMGMPATGKNMTVDGVDIITMKDGKATEHWGYIEEMKMMTQLGLMPAPGTPPPADTTLASPLDSTATSKK